MNRQILVVLLIPLFIAACRPVGQPQPGTLPPDLPTSVSPTMPVEQPGLSVPTETSIPALPTSITCAGDDIIKVAESISADYPFVTAEEVLTWFCNGADIEDILVAVATEDETGTTAEEMLLMRAEGLSWEEIWQVVGFSE